MVHLVRHGHVHNPDKILYGRLAEFRLSDAGEAMARAVADSFVAGGFDIGRVVSSPLARAQQTAAPIADAFGLGIDTDDRVIEAANAWEGKPCPKRRQGLSAPAQLVAAAQPVAAVVGRAVHASSATACGPRSRDAAATTPDHDTVIVSHQLPIWVARMAFEHKRFIHDPRSRECAVASVTSFDVSPDGAVRRHVLRDAGRAHRGPAVRRRQLRPIARWIIAAAVVIAIALWLVGARPARPRTRPAM